ncbi:MAG: hypothetical protein EB127_18895, partial [Alphaproteobacteria bacterium]|nr:hypothetical protein [Alphaproteobacteria bacterium]
RKESNKPLGTPDKTPQPGTPGYKSSDSSDSGNLSSGSPSSRSTSPTFSREEKKDRKEAARTVGGITNRIDGKALEANKAAREQAKNRLGNRMSSSLKIKDGLVTRNALNSTSDASLRALNRDIELSKVADNKAGAKEMYGDNIPDYVLKRMELAKQARLKKARERTAKRQAMGFYESRQLLNSILNFINK